MSYRVAKTCYNIIITDVYSSNWLGTDNPKFRWGRGCVKTRCMIGVGGAHPGLEGAEGVFDGRAADAHALRRAVEPVLHGVDHGLMLPALDPAFLAGRALGLQRALGALAVQ